MKNAAPQELSALRARAEKAAAALPPMHADADGRLDSASREALRAAAQSILRKNRAVGASLVLALPGGVHPGADSLGGLGPGPLGQLLVFQR